MEVLGEWRLKRLPNSLARVQVCNYRLFHSKQRLDLNGESAAFDLNDVVWEIRSRVVRIKEILEQFALNGGTHHDQTDFSALLHIADKRTENIGLKGSLMCLIKDQHTISEMLVFMAEKCTEIIHGLAWLREGAFRLLGT